MTLRQPSARLLSRRSVLSEFAQSGRQCRNIEFRRRLRRTHVAEWCKTAPGDDIDMTLEAVSMKGEKLIDHRQPRTEGCRRGHRTPHARARTTARDCRRHDWRRSRQSGQVNRQFGASNTEAKHDVATCDLVAVVEQKAEGRVVAPQRTPSLCLDEIDPAARLFRRSPARLSRM